MLDRNAPPLVKLNPGVQAPDSLFDTGSSNWNYLKRQSFFETGAPRVNQLMPIINPLDTEAMSNLSNSLCPATKVKSLEDVSLSEKSKYCSGAPQQSQNTMATEKVRDRKAISRMYRAKVTEAIKALNNALPYPKMVLSQTRLNGEAPAQSFIHIEEEEDDNDDD